MKTIPMNDQLTQVAERAMQEEYEKFVQNTLDLARKQREARERKNSEAEQPVKPAVSNK